MRSYELTVILDPNIQEDDVPQTMERLTALIEKSGAEIKEVNHWGRRRLSYPIEHHAEGNYVLFRLELEASRTKELQSSLNVFEGCLRHMLMRIGD